MRAHNRAVSCLCLIEVLRSSLWMLFAVAAGCAAPLSPILELHGDVPAPSDGAAFDAALFQTTGARFWRGHRVRLEDDGRVFDAIVDDIDHARVSVNFVSYIWHSGEPSDRIL